MRLPLLALACLLPLAASSAHASDASVKSRLEARGVKYEIDDDGDYKILVSYKADKRTQLVFVSGATQSVKGFQVREVFSPVGRVEEDGIAKQALALLEENRRMKIGAWEVADDVLYFVIKLPDTVDATQLEAAIEIAAQNADDKEIELSGDKDAF